MQNKVIKANIGTKQQKSQTSMNWNNETHSVTVWDLQIQGKWDHQWSAWAGESQQLISKPGQPLPNSDKLFNCSRSCFFISEMGIPTSKGCGKK